TNASSLPSQVPHAGVGFRFASHRDWKVTNFPRLLISTRSLDVEPLQGKTFGVFVTCVKWFVVSGFVERSKIMISALPSELVQADVRSASAETAPAGSAPE